MITGIGDVDVPPGATVAFDARTGSFEVAPDESRIRATIAERRGERERAVGQADQPAITRDGTTIDVLVNVGVVQDAIDARGADGSGLVRTEVLFGDRRTAPTVDEQVDAFRAIAQALGNKPITIRTWDIGGDKPLPFLPQAKEANPFLGERGLRVFRSRPDLLRDQLEAVRRVAAETPVHVMFPMVTTADEVAWALDELGATDGLEVGIMVEVPRPRCASPPSPRISTSSASAPTTSRSTRPLPTAPTARSPRSPMVWTLRSSNSSTTSSATPASASQCAVTWPATRRPQCYWQPSESTSSAPSDRRSHSSKHACGRPTSLRSTPPQC